jgi:hypothetical protein
MLQNISTKLIMGSCDRGNGPSIGRAIPAQTSISIKGQKYHY